MIKVVLWDYTGESDAYAQNYRSDNVEIIRTLRPDDHDQAKVILRGDWDYVLIFEQGQREIFDEIFKMMHAMKVSTDNIIFAKNYFDVLNHSAAVLALYKPTTEMYIKVQRQSDFYSHKRWNYKYISCSAEGLHYVGSTACVTRGAVFALHFIEQRRQ